MLPDPAGLTVTEDWRPHLPELVALHNSDDLGAPRSESTFRMLAERKWSRLFVARRAGRPIAYAGVGGAAVREYGGDPRAIAALIRAVFHRLDDPDTSTSERPPGQRATIELTVTTPALRTGLPALLAQVGIPHSLGYMGMIAILDAPGLFEAPEHARRGANPQRPRLAGAARGTHAGTDARSSWSSSSLGRNGFPTLRPACSRLTSSNGRLIAV